MHDSSKDSYRMSRSLSSIGRSVIRTRIEGWIASYSGKCFSVTTNATSSKICSREPQQSIYDSMQCTRLHAVSVSGDERITTNLEHLGWSVDQAHSDLRRALTQVNVAHFQARSIIGAHFLYDDHDQSSHKTNKQTKQTGNEFRYNPNPMGRS